MDEIKISDEARMHYRMRLKHDLTKIMAMPTRTAEQYLGAYNHLLEIKRGDANLATIEKYIRDNLDESKRARK